MNLGFSRERDFWHDLWCGDMSFKEASPGLFGIALAKDAFVVTLFPDFPSVFCVELIGSVIFLNKCSFNFYLINSGLEADP